LFKQELHNRIYLILFSVLAFSLPLNRIISSYLIGLIILNWFLEGRFIKKFRSVSASHHRLDTLLFAGLFLAYLAGMIYTSNTREGWTSVQVKLSMFVFPVVFATLDTGTFEGNKRLIPLFSMIAGTFVSGLVCLGWAFVKYSDHGDPGSFYYIDLSVFHHPGYMAMFMVFSVALLNYFLQVPPGKRKYRVYEKVMMIFLILFYSGFVILLSSKAGIITLILIFFLHISYVIFIRRKYLYGSGLVLVISLMFVVLLKLFPYSVTRFGVTGDVMATEQRSGEETSDGTVERILIWRHSMELVNEHFFFGLGTGDVTDALVALYDSIDFHDARDKKLNAHNEYLQTFLTLGIAGFLILLLSLLLPAIYSIRKKQYVYFAFLLIIGFNILVESMFLRQAGVVFYAFFNAFLFMIPLDPGEK